MKTDNSNKVTNLDYLIDLSKGNTEFVAEMIEIFLSEGPKEITWLEKAVNERDFEQVKSCAHKMRSSIPFIGLDKIIEAEIIEIETLATSQSDGSTPLSTNIQKIEMLFSKVKDIYHRAVQELNE